MPTYVYRARTAGNQLISGTAEASAPAEVARILQGRNLTPVRITPTRANLNRRGKRIKVKDLAIFSRLLATLIDAGIPLLGALDILSKQLENANLARITGEVKLKIEGGDNLSDAISAYPKVFNRLYVNMIRAGENGGKLDNILNRLADHLEKQVALQGKIKSSMTYPVSVLIIAFGITYFMLTVIVPKFAEILTQMGTEMPLITKFLIALSDGARTMLIPLLLLIPILGYGFTRLNATPSGRRQIDSVKLKIPMIGNVIRKGSIATFSSTLGLLLQSGVTIINALEITRATAGNTQIEDAISNAKLAVETGEPMHTALSATPIFPPMVVSMVSIGEETGSLDNMLNKVAQFYEREVEDAIEAMTSAIEPALMVFLGVVVGGIVVGLFMPLFSVLGTLAG